MNGKQQSSSWLTTCGQNGNASFAAAMMMGGNLSQSDSLIHQMAASFMRTENTHRMDDNSLAFHEFPNTSSLVSQDTFEPCASLSSQNNFTSPRMMGGFYGHQQHQCHQQNQRADNSALAKFLDSALDQVIDDIDPIEDLSSLFDTPSLPAQASSALPSLKQKSAPSSPIHESPPAKRQRRLSIVSADEEKTPRFRPYQEQQWDEQYEELRKFKADRGHCLVPHTFPENPILSRWVKRQRYQYKLKQENKTSTMTDLRIQQLEDIGFVWDSHGAAWQERCNELAAYKQANGDCNVPSKYPENPQLATWVKCQRRQCKLFWNGKPSNMTLDRFTSLNELGFSWELRGPSRNTKSTFEL